MREWYHPPIDYAIFSAIACRFSAACVATLGVAAAVGTGVIVAVVFIWTTCDLNFIIHW